MNELDPPVLNPAYVLGYTEAARILGRTECAVRQQAVLRNLDFAPVHAIGSMLVFRRLDVEQSRLKK